MNELVGQKPYILNWEEITNHYIKTGQSDVPHFASQYGFTKFIQEGRSKEKENMQAMYLEILAVLNLQIERGNLTTEIV